MPTLRDPLIDVANIGGADLRYSPLPPGSTLTENMQGVLAPYTVWVEPATGDTVTVEYRTAQGKDWQAWPPGPVTSYAEHRLGSQIHSLRYSSSGGASGSQCGVARPVAAEWEAL
jgi:hypothetical protein